MTHLVRFTAFGALLSLAGLLPAAEDAADVKVASAPAAVAGSGTSLHVFVLGSNKEVYHLTREGEKASWESLGGKAQYGVGAASNSDRVDVFTVAQNGHLVQKTFDKNWQKEWVDLGKTPGGKCISAPAAATSPKGRLHVFVLGANNEVYRCEYDGKDWSWNGLGGNARYGVAATSRMSRLDVFTVAKNGHLVQKTFDKNAWGKDWADLGTPKDAKCNSAPGATSRGVDRYDVFVLSKANKLAKSGTLHQCTYDGKDWQWAQVGDNVRYGASAVARGGKLHLFSVSREGQLVARTYDKEWDKEWKELRITRR